MLAQLFIRNIAVIEKASIDLEKGFTVLTGETGAGKSIIIDAIHAVLGERTSKELVRTGTDSASVSALFTGLDEDTLSLLDQLSLPREEDGEAIERAEEALAAAHRIIGQCPVVIDYTATARPLGLARLLLEHGFQVQTVYADSFSGEEKEDFLWLQAHAPELTLRPTVQVKMRLLPRQRPEKTLAIGQKAAYFTSSRFFVNLVEGGGLYGYDGVRRMAQLMLDAYLHERDTRTLIQVKGLGCGCCV